MKRNAAVVILAVIAIFAGIVAVFDLIRYLDVLTSGFDFFGVTWLGAIFTGLVALIWFWAASRVWNVDPQGWLFMVSIAAIYLVFDVIAIIGGTPWELLMPSIFMSALALIIGLLPSTKEAFGTA